MHKVSTAATAFVALIAILCTPIVRAEGPRDFISIVGSSTVFPFAATVAERFQRAHPQFKTPIVESNGTGGGFKLFCGGVGSQYPDIANASRRMKASELETCVKNSVKEVAEIKIGYDGITIATRKGAPAYALTRKELYLAVAKQVPDPNDAGTLIANPYHNWSDINAKLPKQPIQIYGPAPNHGTRDAFAELVMEAGCTQYAWLKSLQDVDEGRYKRVCTQVREDGAWTDVSEDYAMIVGKLTTNAHALAVFTFSYLDQNRDKLVAAEIDGKIPTFTTIGDGSYTISRPLYFYVKKAHLNMAAGLRDYIAEFVSDKALGADGYLVDKGLIPLKPNEANAVRKDATDLRNLRL